MNKKQLTTHILKLAEAFVAEHEVADKITDAQLINFMIEIWQDGQRFKEPKHKDK
jgi:hypothetical protein